MKVLGFLVAALMLTLGAIGLLIPNRLIEMARFTTTPNGIYLAAGVRIAIGAILWMLASRSRFPKILRVLATLALIGGIGTLVLGSQRAREIADWVSANGTLVVRAFGVFALAIASFIAFAISDRRYV
jgi:hypothetical protein